VITKVDHDLVENLLARMFHARHHSSQKIWFCTSDLDEARAVIETLYDASFDITHVVQPD